MGGDAHKENSLICPCSAHGGTRIFELGAARGQGMEAKEIVVIGLSTEEN